MRIFISILQDWFDQANAISKSQKQMQLVETMSFKFFEWREHTVYILLAHDLSRFQKKFVTKNFNKVNNKRQLTE